MQKLSVIIPVYNEKNTILNILEKVKAAPAAGLEKEVIVVDDASGDGSADILKNLSGEYKVFFHAVNAGKGAAIKTGLQRATGDFVVIQDADLEYDPKEYDKLLEPLLSNRADVVYGSRFLGGGAHRVLYYWHCVGNKILTWLSNMFTNLNLTDMETCYKMFSKKVLDDIKDKLTSQRFGIEPEITARIKKYRVYEVGISYSGRTYEEGKKIGWKDGFSAIWCIIKFNLFR